MFENELFFTDKEIFFRSLMLDDKTGKDVSIWLSQFTEVWSPLSSIMEHAHDSGHRKVWTTCISVGRTTTTIARNIFILQLLPWKYKLGTN